MNLERPSLFGLFLTTHRDKTLGAEVSTYFQFEAGIAAISILFFRATVHSKDEPALIRWLFSLLLAFLAYSKKPYELIIAVELFSYAVPSLLLRTKGTKASFSPSSRSPFMGLLAILASAILSLLLSHLLLTGKILLIFRILTPRFVIAGLQFLVPIDEIASAYDVMAAFADSDVLNKQIVHLFFVTFHIQVAMGFLGIDFLRKEQDRRNQLVRMDISVTEDDKANGETDERTVMMKRAESFRKSALPFIILTALPYMFQIIVFGNINTFAFTCLCHDLHRIVRINQVFDHDSHLIAMANTPMTPESFSMSMSNVVSTSYDIFNRKMFSLPKIMLLPSVMSRQPMLVVQVFPLIVLSDWVKAAAVAMMTNKIEALQKEMQDLKSIRSKIESFDIKNAELLQRSGAGATQFTQRRWEQLTVKVQERMVLSDLLSRSKGFFSFIHRNFVFSALIDCALANLISVGKIVSADTFVFSRAIEDAIDMVLMRSRGEAELARMMTDIEKLKDLYSMWNESKDRSLLNCKLASPSDRRSLVLRNLHYSRGTAQVRADHIELQPGVYALTGSNGSGKSTLFRVLMSCHTNVKSIELPSSINLLTPMEPLTEEDDLLRQSCCETPGDDEMDDGTDDASRELVVGMDGESIQSTPATSSSKLVDSACHPRLSITMPSSHVVEISQNFYFPLYSKPIDWIYHEHVFETSSPEQLGARARLVAEELQTLQFFQSAVSAEPNEGTGGPNLPRPDDMLMRLMQELQEEKEDWFSELSGGQRSKVELVRKVFLHDRCPEVLLVDETMAPLDPASKSLVMNKLKQFCDDSIIIVIYHTDVGRGKEADGKAVDCIPSNDFFDKNIHIEKGVVHLRETC